MKELATIQQVFPSIPEAMEARPSGKADILEMDGMPQQALQAMLEKIEDAWWDRDIPPQLVPKPCNDAHIRLRHVTDYDFNNIKLMSFPELDDVFKQEVDDVLSALSRHYEYCDFTAIILLLPAGAKIEPHVDQGRWFRLAHRINVPLVTNPDVEFRVGGRLCEHEGRQGL